MPASTILDRIRELLAKTEPFSVLGAATRDAILADLSVEYFQPGEVVIEQGSTVHRGLYLVESGTVRLMDVAAQRLIDKCGEGDTFGSFGLIKGGAHIYEAKVTEPTVCALIKGERFQKLYEDYAEVASFFDRDLRQYVRHLGSSMDVVGSHVLFSRRLERLAYRPVLTLGPEATVQEAARQMTKAGVSVALVQQGERTAGLFTDADLRRKILARGRSAETPVRSVMSSPAETISGRATLFEAMTMMLRAQRHHLVVTEAAPGRAEAGSTVLGILSDRDLAHARGQDPLATAGRISAATTVGELVGIREEIMDLLLRLYRQGVQPEALGRLATLLQDRLVVRLLHLAERSLRVRHGDERVDLPWAWLRLGAGGRQEMGLHLEQYNAIVYADPEADEQAARAEAWFARLGEAVHEDLAACGFSSSAVVAKDAQWRKALGAWRRTYRAWIHEASEEDLAKVPFFLDLRAVYGDARLEAALKETLEDALNVQQLDQQRHVLSLMAANAVSERPPLSFFRRFVVERSGEHSGSLDLWRRGLLPIVDAARVLALETRYFATTSTYDRLHHVAQALPELEAKVDNLLDAYRFLADVYIERQLRAFEEGEVLGHRINPAALTALQRNLMRSAFSAVEAVQEALVRRYGLSRRRSI